MSEPISPPDTSATVTLREITAETVGGICRLEVKPEQRDSVAPNAFSLAQALFSNLAWYRAIYANETPVGFVMLEDDPASRHYYLWRYMIAAEHQGKGFGRQALEQVIAYVRGRPGAKEFLLSYVPGEHGPREFYRRLGFEDTGVMHGDEMEMRLTF